MALLITHGAGFWIVSFTDTLTSSAPLKGSHPSGTAPQQGIGCKAVEGIQLMGALLAQRVGAANAQLSGDSGTIACCLIN